MAIPKHAQEYRRAAAQSGPRSYCFGTTTSGEPSTWLPLGKLEGQERLPAIIFYLEFSKKYHDFQFFQKVWIL